MKSWKIFKNNCTIKVTGILAILYCIICIIFKSCSLNIPAIFRPLAEFLYNMAISIIAAIIFYIVQVYIPNRKKQSVLEKYAKRYIKEKLLKEYNLLKTKTDGLLIKKYTEEKINSAIDSSCIKIKVAIGECMAYYMPALSEVLIQDINDVLYNDMFDMISMRANGKLSNMSMEEVLKDQKAYQSLWNIFESIKKESNKLSAI